MNFSAMDRRVTILTYAPTTGSMGGVSEAWIDGDTVWAEKRPQPGRVSTDQFIAAGQIINSAFVYFFIRWRGDITPKSRLRCEGIEYDIVAFREIGRRDGVEITATSRVS